MAQSKNTKRALLASILSVVLCCAMLIGSTFAWFTDSVETGKNTITAGNLDVDLQYAEVAEGTDLTTLGDDAWTSVQGKEDLFSEDLWEPGHVEVVYLRIQNLGTLALDYNLRVYAFEETLGTNKDGESFKLSDYLKFAVVQDVAAAYADRAAAVAAAGAGIVLGGNSQPSGEALPAGEDGVRYLALVVWMPSTVGNEANYLTGTTPPSVELGVRLEATQAMSESDSFGPDYDEFADGTPDHPEFGKPIETVETKADALNTTVVDTTETVKGETTVNLGGIVVTYPDGAVLDANSQKDAGDNTADATQGLVYTGNTTDKAITVEGNNVLGVYELTLPVADTNDTLLKIVKNIGANQTVVKVYHNETALTESTGGEPDGTGITGDQGYYAYDVRTGNLTLWVLHASEISVEFKSLFAGGAGTETDPFQIASCAQLANIYLQGFEKPYYYKLTQDIEVANVYTVSNTYPVVTPYLKNAVLDGDNHTITISGEKSFNLFYFVQDATIKNLKVANIDNALTVWCCDSTFDNVDVSGDYMEVGNNTGAYVIYATQDEKNGNVGTIRFTDCNANVKMVGGGAYNNYNAVFVGYAFGVNGGTYTTNLVFTNCTNEGSLVCGKASMFLGNVPNPTACVVNLTVNNCRNNGLIQSTYMGSEWTAYSHFISSNAQAAQNTLVLDDTTYDNLLAEAVSMGDGFVHGPNDASLELKLNEDNTFTITKSENANASYYTVTVSTYSRITNDGGTCVISVSEKISAAEEMTTKVQLLGFVDQDYLDQNSHTLSTIAFTNEGTAGINQIATVGDNSYYFMNVPGYNTQGKVFNSSAAVSAYDADGNLLASAPLSK